MGGPEIWRPIPVATGYEVSDYGRVRRGPRVLSQHRNRKGYHQTNVSCDDGRRRCLLVSRLVCAAFNGAAPEGLHTAHWDGDKSNNRPGNLRWATPKENAEDLNRQGRQARGERMGSAKLTAEQVAEIRAAPFGEGINLAKRFGVSTSTISNARTGITWAAAA